LGKLSLVLIPNPYALKRDIVFPKTSKSQKTRKMENDRFEVEHIVDHRQMENGDRFYRVRWQGYSPRDDTWVNTLINNYFYYCLIESYLWTLGTNV
jgi:hypothetical protein